MSLLLSLVAAPINISSVVVFRVPVYEVPTPAEKARTSVRSTAVCNGSVLIHKGLKNTGILESPQHLMKSLPFIVAEHSVLNP